MACYGVWNYKGGVGKSYLTYQIASEYARQHPTRRVIVIDLCPQANASSMFLGGMEEGGARLEAIAKATPRLTISGYLEERIWTPYASPRTGASYLTHLSGINHHIPPNVFLVVGDEQLDAQAGRVLHATAPGHPDAWRIVHQWICDLVVDIQLFFEADTTTFIDCSPSFTIFTELAVSASERLIIPFTADGASKQAIRGVLASLFGVSQYPGSDRSEFCVKAQFFRMRLPQIYCYVGNRLTSAENNSAAGFRAVVNAVGDEIWSAWLLNHHIFFSHPTANGFFRSQIEFKKTFQAELLDTNTVSVVSSALGIPISRLTAGPKVVSGREIIVNQSQLNKHQPNLSAFVKRIE